MRPGPRNLITDVTGLIVGNAQDDQVKTGTTVLTSPRPFTAGVHVMGGAPGTTETELLAPERLVQEVDALVLSGGSALGLGAADGVRTALRAAGRGFAVQDQHVPIVAGAILMDLTNGGDKDFDGAFYPDLGARALANAASDFTLGTAGAGVGATTYGLKGGLGSASVKVGRYTVGALVAVNALGSVVTGEQGAFWAAPFELDAEFGGLEPATGAPQLDLPMPEKGKGEATSIAIVATDAALTQAQAKRLAIAAHDGLARAIVPSHTLFDGDLVFAASTGALPMDDPLLIQYQLGHAAAICLARATARGVYCARSSPEDLLPSWNDKHGTSGGT